VKKGQRRKAAAKRPAARADFGASVEGFFAKQPAHPRDAVRAWVRTAAAQARTKR